MSAITSGDLKRTYSKCSSYAFVTLMLNAIKKINFVFRMEDRGIWVCCSNANQRAASFLWAPHIWALHVQQGIRDLLVLWAFELHLFQRWVPQRTPRFPIHCWLSPSGGNQHFHFQPQRAHFRPHFQMFWIFPGRRFVYYYCFITKCALLVSIFASSLSKIKPVLWNEWRKPFVRTK